jgi:hypothetical protein
MEDKTDDPCNSSLGPLQPKLPCHVTVIPSTDDAISDLSERTSDNTGSEFSNSSDSYIEQSLSTANAIFSSSLKGVQFKSCLVTWIPVYEKIYFTGAPR